MANALWPLYWNHYETVRFSNYAPNQCPKAMVIEMATAGSGIRYHSETEFADGRRFTSTYTAEYDGAEVLVSGANGLRLKLLDERTVEASYLRAMKVVASSRRVVSPNVRTLTITTVSKDKEGKEAVNIGVYEKVD